MEARQMNVLSLLGKEGVRYEIPPFQRSYAWDRSQCEDLLTDVVRAAREHRQHFASAILYVACSPDAADGGTSSPPPTCFHVVDGQQRLTTISLMLLALCRKLEKDGACISGTDARTLSETYLKIGQRTKLLLSPADRETLHALIFGEPLPAHPSHHVVDNLAYFQEQLEAPECSPDLVWTGLGSLFCVAIQLDEADRPQAVFESLNAKGAALTTADMVRNYLLFGKSHAEQQRLYLECWEPMQALFGDDPGSLRMNNAILGWLSVRSPKNRAHRDKQAFRVFRQYFEQHYDGSVEALLAELHSFCLVWAENYRYHAVKNYRSADWASIGKKTLVSDRPKKQASEEALHYYAQHFGINVAH